MLPDLERLIHLQETRNRAQGRPSAWWHRRPSASLRSMPGSPPPAPGSETAKAAIAENQTARRMVDKDLAASQQRLEKYKEQSMAVKTNHEFHAMQHQMEAVKAEIDHHESKVARDHDGRR